MPALYEHSSPRKVKIDFSAPVGSISNDTSGSHSAPTYQARPAHDGMRDIGSPGNGQRVLLLRGLNYHSKGDEIVWRLSQEIARLVGKVGREKEAEGTICRLVLIVDRAARSSWGYGFVELATPEVSQPPLLAPSTHHCISSLQLFCLS